MAYSALRSLLTLTATALLLACSLLLAGPWAVVGYLAQVYRRPRPRFIIIEPRQAACIFASVAAGDGKRG